MSNTNKIVFRTLKMVAWVIFIGLSVEAGGLLVNFIFSLYKPEFVHNLYQKLDLSELYFQHKPAFFGMYSFILSIAFLKAYLFYLVVRLVSKLDLEKPFNSFVSRQITQISYFTFSIGIISYIGRATAKYLSHKGYATNEINQFLEDSQAFILMAAIVYIIGAIFAKGIEIQNENDLTV